MTAAAAWDGKITIEEAWLLFKIGGGISVTGHKEQMNGELPVAGRLHYRIGI